MVEHILLAQSTNVLTVLTDEAGLPQGYKNARFQIFQRKSSIY